MLPFATKSIMKSVGSLKDAIQHYLSSHFPSSQMFTVSIIPTAAFQKLPVTSNERSFIKRTTFLVYH